MWIKGKILILKMFLRAINFFHFIIQIWKYPKFWPCFFVNYLKQYKYTTWCIFGLITFYGRDSLINSACHHHHSARLSTILHQPSNCKNHRNIIQKTLAAPDASMQTALPKQWLLLPTDDASSHTSIVAQQHLHKELGRRFVDKFSWHHHHPIARPYFYYFWNAVKQEVYSWRRAPSKNLEVLKKRSNRFSAAAVKSKC